MTRSDRSERTGRAGIVASLPERYSCQKSCGKGILNAITTAERSHGAERAEERMRKRGVELRVCNIGTSSVLRRHHCDGF